MIRCAEHHWGREWNAGEKVMCGTGKGLLKLYVFKSLFLRTVSNLSARIPLPSSKPPVPVVLESTFSPGEGLRLAPLNDKVHFFDSLRGPAEAGLLLS